MQHSRFKKKNLQICNESLNASRGSYSFWSSLKETSTQKTEAFHGLTVKVWMTQVTVFFFVVAAQCGHLILTRT